MLRLSLLLLLSFAKPVWADLHGPVHVIDGDTIDVGETRVRLHAIDAPETDQLCGSANSPAWACGEWVRSEARALFQGKKAHCDVRDTDQYGRAVATCFVDDKDIGEALVLDGLAFAYRTYGWDYDLAEKQAAVRGVGLHATGVTSPAAFRAAQRRVVKPQNAPDACAIKGNISRDGKRIYHVAGQSFYAKTSIDVSKGERWFCSEAEARAAGWRKARK